MCSSLETGGLSLGQLSRELGLAALHWRPGVWGPTGIQATNLASGNALTRPNKDIQSGGVLSGGL